MEVAFALRRYPLFSVLPPPVFDAWLKQAGERTLEAGETVFQEGTPGNWAHLVLAGSIRIVQRSGRGRELVMGSLGPGEVFGEYALLPPHSNIATCRAATPARVLALPLLPLKPWLQERIGNLKDWLRLHGLLAFLRGQCYLGFMSAQTALTFQEALVPETFHPQETIQTRGLADQRFFVIEQGSVGIFADEQNSEPAQILGPGDCLGAQALLDGQGLPLAVAQSETRCLALSRAQFLGDEVARFSVQSLEPQTSTLHRNFPWIGQVEPADCGLAALVMVTRFHGREISLAALRATATVAADGLNLAQLMQLARGIGLNCRPVRVSPGHVGRLALPAIAHCANGHFVVLYQWTAGECVLGDPATGIVRISPSLFEQRSSGHFLLLEPSN